MPDRRLQPLRLSLGWKVAWNSFYEIDPPTDWDANNDSLFFNEDMLLLQNQRSRVLIDVGWLPYGPRGRFVLSAINWLGDAEMPEQWHRPLAQFRSRSRARIVAKLERWTGDDFDWLPLKAARGDRTAEPLKPSYVRTQKLYESEES